MPEEKNLLRNRPILLQGDRLGRNTIRLAEILENSRCRHKKGMVAVRCTVAQCSDRFEVAEQSLQLGAERLALREGKLPPVQIQPPPRLVLEGCHLEPGAQRPCNE